MRDREMFDKRCEYGSDMFLKSMKCIIINITAKANDTTDILQTFR